MSKDLPENIAYSSSADNTAASAQPGDILYSFMHAPVSKLDADQYMVSDLDGVTEGLFGSGNMNFLMMQSAQTNEAIQNTNPMDADIGSDSFGAGLIGTSAAPGLFGSVNQASDLEFFNPLASPDDMNAVGGSDISGAYGPGGAGGLGASTFAGHAQSQDPFYSARNLGTSDSSIDHNFGTNGRNGSDGTSGTSGTSGTNGTSGTSGTNGTDGTDGTGTTIINNVDLTEINEAVTNLFDTVNNVTDNVFNTINNLFPGGDLGPIGLDLGLGLSNLTDLTLDLINGDSILNVLDETLDLSPVLDPITGIVGDIASGVDLGVLFDPFQYDNSANDHDLNITSGLELLGMPILPIALDVPLDPVEFLLGDIDLNLDLTNDLLGLPLLGGDDNGDNDLDLDLAGNLLGTNLIDLPLDLVLNPVEDLVGDLDIGLGGGLDLLGNSETNNALGDTDITLPLDLNLGGQNLLSDVINIPLDPVEAITGDIDLDLTLAGDVLGNVADSLIDGFDGGSGDNNILSQLGDIVGDLAGNLLPSMGGTDVTSDLNAGLLDNLPLTEDLNLSLDTVENLLSSNLDIASGIGLDLLGTSTDAENPNDVILGTGLDLLDQGIIGDGVGLGIPLDPFESLLGDIDIDEAIDIDLVHSMPDATVLQDILGSIDTALNQAVDLIEHAPATLGITDIAGDLLGGGLTDIIGGDTLGGTLPSWTESVLPDAGDILGGGLTNDVSSLLLDPVAAVTSILPSVPVLPVLTGGLGGLGSGGNNHFGGLFG